MMNVNQILKSNPVIRCFGKKVKIYNEFCHDAQNFAKYYVESAEKSGDYRYSIMLLVHSLEKGMCMPNPRPFGFDKVRDLMRLLGNYSEKSCFEYEVGVSVLNAWKVFFEEHNWQSEKYYKEVVAFLSTKKFVYETGYKKYLPVIELENEEDFEKIIFSRHSVRDYKDEPIKNKDLKLALKAFVETPTACNRQMCRVIGVKDTKIKTELNKVIIGLPGFNKKHVNFFIITYDLAAFAYSGERQQGLLNTGLCTMNFVNALHAKGIGSCCLQWSNKHSEDRRIRKLLGLKDSERIGVIVGAGYYLPENTIPCSVRRPISDIYREV
ncbi:hypothetical protein DXB01_04335 [Clostridium sp. OF10-22XD]|nr:hypothetical protein DXB01_04335 [Clostridium sp. OF10-22XD]